ncbi:hypothetical protein KTQ42_23155 [Noviherbaspirillum sp. L7-7A]|uniref:hypothetical protein n=1 Tax=Noviherbaspirillum sp. L7-7A TaxID=2850560 RepID=UPI001C2C11C2|nr:hypothetical protein [Noviherbaspirillum sp. L7-7A]MBV0882177.1 hypothetical protein [Noviherbaspirillum sp. L7-7A]
MQKIMVVLAVLLVTGCSSMGMGGSSNATSGRSDMNMTRSSGYSTDREPVIKSNGNLSLYHGG